MADKVEAKVVRTPRGIASYPHVFAAFVSERDRKLGREPKFSMTMLFDAAAQQTAEWADIKAEANRFALAYFGEAKLKQLIADGQFKSPFINGDRLAQKNPECAGKILLRLSTKTKPGVVDAQVRPIDDETKIYPGCIVMASINAYAYEPTKDNPAQGHGVSFGLRNVQLVDGTTPALGNRTRPEDDFVPLNQAVAQGGADPGAMF